MHVSVFPHRIEWLAANVVIRRAQRVSDDRAESLGRALGSLAWHVMPRRRRIARTNVQRCLEDVDASAISRCSFDHFGRTLVEALRLPDDAPHVQWRKPDHLAPLIERQQAAVIVGAHLGNWEVAAWAIAGRAGCLHLIVAPPSNPYRAAFVHRHRQHWGIVPHERGGSVRPIVRALKDGYLVGTAADQWPGAYPSVEAEFLGLPTHLGTGIFSIALHARASVIALAAIRTEEGFEIVTEPVWSGDDPLLSPEQLVRRWVVMLEGQIRRYPEQYLWMHNRWKALSPVTTPVL